MLSSLTGLMEASVFLRFPAFSSVFLLSAAARGRWRASLIRRSSFSALTNTCRGADREKECCFSTNRWEEAEDEVVLARGLPGKHVFSGTQRQNFGCFRSERKKEAESDSSGDDSRGRNHWKGNYGLPWGRVPSFWKISTRVAFKNGQDLPAGMKSSSLFFSSFFFFSCVSSDVYL